MKITQIAPYVNAALKETLGEQAIATDDLSNIVDQGALVESGSNSNLLDTFTKGLMNQIGKMVFVERPYDGIAPSVLMDGAEWGSVFAKVSADMPEAQEDQSWNLTDGSTYPPVFYETEAQTHIYNSTNPYEFRRSIYYDQLHQSFRSAEDMARFISMIETQLQNAATIAVDNTIRATINNAIASTIYAEFSGSEITGKTGVKAVNLLYLYNQAYPDANLTVANCIHSPEFIRFAIYVKNIITDRMRGMNALYNIDGKTRFTPTDKLQTILLSQFADAAGVFLYDGIGQFKTENIGLGTIETVPYWQGIGKTFGTDLGFSEASKIDVKTSGGNNVAVSGILGIVYDKDALGVFNKREKVTTDYSGAGDFWTNYYKYRAQYFNSFQEQLAVLYVA